MRTEVKYEWSLETMDGENIVDSDFAGTLTAEWLADGSPICLVRNEGNENEGITGRMWAYINDGKLPEYFSNEMGNEIDYKVPVKFHKELSQYIK